MAQGRVREGHGDLRAEHICLVGEIEIFDCVEFDAALRYGDIASEIAFLAMDLDFFGCDPNEVSDANWAVYQKMREQFESFSELPRNCHAELTTDQNLARALGKLQAKL